MGVSRNISLHISFIQPLGGGFSYIYFNNHSLLIINNLVLFAHIFQQYLQSDKSFNTNKH